MAQDIKLRGRIKTLKSLNLIFSALQVITVTKLSKARERLNSARKFRDEIDETLKSSGPYLHQKKAKNGRTAAILIAGSRGLCGTFNQDIFNRTRSFLAEHKGKEVDFFVFGNQGHGFLRSKKQKIAEFYASDAADFESIRALAEKLWRSIGDGETSEVYLIYNHFYTHFNRRSVANRILPYEAEPQTQSGGMWIMEPDRLSLIEKITFSHFAAGIFFALSESRLGELSARMVTLKSAIDNSKELIDDLTIKQNKARQQMITQEILEIIETSEAIREEN